MLKSYANALDNFRYTSLDADGTHDCILDAVMNHASEISNYDIYAVGSPEFLDALSTRCRDAGLPDAQWHSEIAA